MDETYFMNIVCCRVIVLQIPGEKCKREFLLPPLITLATIKKMRHVIVQ